VIAWDHTEESLTRQLGRAESIGVEAAEAHVALDAAERSPEALESLFPPRSGPHCAWCDYRDHCVAGKEAAPQRRSSWAGLALDITPTIDDVAE
jgi:hypothetical protein